MKYVHRQKLWELSATLFLAAVLFLSFAPAAFSASDYVQLAPIPGTAPATCDKPPCGTTLSTYLTGMFKVGIAAAGILAFLMMVWGGLSYLSTDVITGKEEGKARIQRALGGLVLALASYIILYTINPKLVELNLNFGPAAKPVENLGKPADYNYEAELDKTIKEIYKNLDDTKARATAIENVASDLKAQREEMSKVMEEGDFSQIDKYNELTKKIDSLQAEAQSIRDYNTGIDNFKQLQVNGINNVLTDQTTQVKQEIKSINDEEAKKISKLEADLSKNPGNKADIEKWIQDIHQKADQAQATIAQADINKGNVGIAKNVLDTAYQETQAAIKAAGNDQIKINALNQRLNSVITDIHNRCAASKTLLSCRNYDPATNPANKK